MRFLILLVCCAAWAQGPQFSSVLIPENLKENANAVVRQQQIDISVDSRRNIVVKTQRVVTVFNEYGLKYIDASEHRDVRSIEAVVLDASGKKIKDLKRKDFKQTQASDSFITDDKITYLEYTPVSYPFTIIYTSVISDSNTAFIPSWVAVPGYFCSVEQSAVTITAAPDLGLRHLSKNFDGYQIETTVETNKIRLEAKNIPAIRAEQYSPAFTDVLPHVVFGLDKFHLEGVDGEATSWENFSNWMYHSLLVGTDELSDDTKNRIKALVANESDPIKKARIVYQFVQDKTRYVSIQIGIGGWKPMKAKDVDRLGYGDCKALTNYTRALLDVVGVPSYYCVVFSGQGKQDLTPDFVSMQGNHAILTIPTDAGSYWLECTSQTMPFGYIGDFTDDRLVLPIKSGGSSLTRTTVYPNDGNLQQSTGKYGINAEGTLSGSIEIVSRGTQYDNRVLFERKAPDAQATGYKEHFSNLPNLKLSKLQFKNDKQNVAFTETLELQSERYGNLSGGRIIFPVNAFNSYQNIPQRYRNRNLPVRVLRGFVDVDEVVVEIPVGYSVEALPEKQHIKSKYGEYEFEVVAMADNQFKLKRRFKLNEGNYPKEEYEAFRKFSEQVARGDASKMVIVKT